MCKLCNKIYMKKDFTKWNNENDGEDDNHNIIAKIKNDFVLFSYISDWYYTYESNTKINYCPLCGRELC